MAITAALARQFGKRPPVEETVSNRVARRGRSVTLRTMRSSILSLGALALGLSAATPAADAAPGPTEAVRTYFAALDRQDFTRAIALTDGDAQARTSRMVSTLQKEAAQHHARVEVKVTRLAVQAPGAPELGRGVPVPVQFHIDVIGHKWMFNKVARVLEGQAQFYVNPQHTDRIIAIEGNLL